MVDNVEIARRYLAAIEAAVSFDEVAAFLTDDIVQEEFPNRLSPSGARRDLAGMREAAEKGRNVMRAQRARHSRPRVPGALLRAPTRRAPW